jgi:hypothetical protein
MSIRIIVTVMNVRFIKTRGSLNRKGVNKLTRAKFKLEEKTEFGAGYGLKFRAVTSGCKENEQFFQYTPSGELSMIIVKKETADQFVVGQEYYLDLTSAEQ